MSQDASKIEIKCNNRIEKLCKELPKARSTILHEKHLREIINLNRISRFQQEFHYKTQAAYNLKFELIKYIIMGLFLLIGIDIPKV